MIRGADLKLLQEKELQIITDVLEEHRNLFILQMELGIFALLTGREDVGLSDWLKLRVNIQQQLDTDGTST